MVKCTYCGSVLTPGTGKMLIKNDSSLNYYCSLKCEKNSNKLHRNPRNVRWTEASRKLRNKA